MQRQGAKGAVMIPKLYDQENLLSDMVKTLKVFYIKNRMDIPEPYLQTRPRLHYYATLLNSWKPTKREREYFGKFDIALTERVWNFQTNSYDIINSLDIGTVCHTIDGVERLYKRNANYYWKEGWNLQTQLEANPNISYEDLALPENQRYDWEGMDKHWERLGRNEAF